MRAWSPLAPRRNRPVLLAALPATAAAAGGGRAWTAALGALREANGLLLRLAQPELDGLYEQISDRRGIVLPAMPPA